MVKRVLEASDLALVTTEWLFIAIGSDGKHVDITSKSADSNSLTELGNLLSIIVEEQTNTGPSVPII
ncbi:MAG: hypothetical protein WBL67_11425 [Nitrososphaeraceae archaeon]